MFQVRFEEVPLPIPSRASAEALQLCTVSSSSNASHRAPELEGMMPKFSTTRPLDPLAGADGASQGSFSSIFCESRTVQELVQLCIMHNVSAVNGVLLMRTPQSSPPIHLHAYVQVYIGALHRYQNC